jgi:hypothetical protein
VNQLVVFQAGGRAGNHTFRATGITTYLKNDGKLEHATKLLRPPRGGDFARRGRTDRDLNLAGYAYPLILLK